MLAGNAVRGLGGLVLFFGLAFLGEFFFGLAFLGEFFFVLFFGLFGVRCTVFTASASFSRSRRAGRLFLSNTMSGRDVGRGRLFPGGGGKCGIDAVTRHFFPRAKSNIPT